MLIGVLDEKVTVDIQNTSHMHKVLLDLRWPSIFFKTILNHLNPPHDRYTFKRSI